MATESQVTWERVAAQVVATPGTRIAYADESPLQFGVLRIPATAGPHPVAIVLHGGCWLAQFDHRHVEALAQALTARGVATWVLEYRRLGNAGGGWPGTFLDVARGADWLREAAPRHGLDVERVVAVGHSAGGHLALWLAARAHLAAGDELHLPQPLRLAGVVALAAIADLASYSQGAGSCNAAVVELMGGRPDERAERYAQGNPFQLLAGAAPLRLVHGVRDTIVPAAQSERLAAATRARGGAVTLDLLEGAGHFDVVAPFAPAWQTVERRVLEVVRCGE
jgi:acetyl esterase/lipase